MNVATITGLALATISFALVVLARIQLGKSFAVTPKAKDLVTHGLYSALATPHVCVCRFDNLRNCACDAPLVCIATRGHFVATPGEKCP